ncbi:MAG: tetratricopeptide repeat protein [Acetobacteraceae bacterium]|nr:tetratricopeptide repeat protein [Acetobacteraceae bacterium]
MEEGLRLLQAAIGQLNAGALTEAAATCERLQAVMPGHPAVLQLQATLSLRSGDPAAAARFAADSLARRPGHGPTLLLTAQAAIALQRAGQRDLALAAWTCTAAAPDASARAHAGLGLLLREMGKLPVARDALERAAELDPSLSQVWFALGLTRQDLGDEAGAAEAFRAALQAQPDLAEAAVNLGLALQRQGLMAPALDAYRVAVRLRPDTIGRVAQSLAASSTGQLALDGATLRTILGA